MSVQGGVEFGSVGNTGWQPVQLNDTVCPGDDIRVPDNSRASLSLINESVLRLNGNSTIAAKGQAPLPTTQAKPRDHPMTLWHE